MIAALASWLVARGLSRRFAGPLAWLAVALVAVALLAAAKALYDRAVIAGYEREREAQSAEATVRAAEQRAADSIRLNEQAKGRDNAIQTAPTGDVPSGPARALACERLRQLGRIPPACRPAGGDGSQAAP